MSMAQQPTGERWYQQIAAHRPQIAYGLIGVAAALAVVALVLGYKYGWDQAPIIAGCVVFAVGALAAGLWFLTETTGGLSGNDSARLLVLILGGWLGFSLVKATVWGAVHWWGDISGGTQAWRGKEGWHVWLLAGTGLAGLAVMFFSLLLARSDENAAPGLRRLLYGYITVLTGLLLLAILVIVNILGYLYMPPSTDWTRAGIYTLSSQSENVLKGLDRPVKVYVLLEDRGTRFSAEVHDLMDNARSLTNKLEVEYLVRDLNVDEVERLATKYKLPEAVGLLVVYNPGEQEAYHFIRREEIYKQPARFNPDDAQRGATFNGEDALISTLLFLQEGKQEPVVYFMQGEGEMDLFGALEGAKPDRTARGLRDRLEKAHYKVKGLRLEAGAGKSEDPRVVIAADVPDDAAVVVVLGPRKEFAPAAAGALHKYMSAPRKEKDPADPKKEREIKGKLFVLLDVVPGANDKMQRTGLEALLTEFDVDATNERVLRRSRTGRPDQVVTMTNPNLRERNPLAANLVEPLVMSGLRMVQARGAGPRPGEPPGRFQAETLMLTAPPIIQQSEVFTSDDMRAPEQVVADFLSLPREEQVKRVRATVPVAVAVSDPSAGDPNDPHAAMMGRPRGEGTPRMVVLGDAKFASDLGIVAGREEGGSLAYELFANSIAWLREKPSSIGITPKDRGVYKMNENTNVSRMTLAPFFIMALGILGLGLGVWVVRRR